MFNRVPKGRASGFEDPIPKSATTRRGRHEARPRSFAESGRKGDPERIGLHRNQEADGNAERVEGKVQNAIGDLKDALKK